MEIANSITSLLGELTDILRQIANPICVLALVIIGIMWIAFKEESKIQTCKSWMIRIAIGMAIINLADVIMNALSKIGS